MSEEDYARLKERYERPPFVFFFNPTIQLVEYIVYNESNVAYCVGYELKRHDGKLVSIDYKD